MDGAILRGDGETGFAGPGAELRVGAIGGEASGGNLLLEAEPALFAVHRKKVLLGDVLAVRMGWHKLRERKGHSSSQSEEWQGG